MVPVKTYELFEKRVQEKYGSEDRIICLLFLDPFNDDLISTYICQRFDYFDKRTGEYVDFFCPGFIIKQERSFNTADFVDFICKFEEITTWHYYGGTNMLLLRYHNGKILYDKVYDLNFTRMIIDGKMNDYRRFMEELIYIFHDIEYHLDNERIKMQIENLWENLSEFLPIAVRKIVKYCRDMKKINSYFKPKNIQKN